MPSAFAARLIAASGSKSRGSRCPFHSSIFGASFEGFPYDGPEAGPPPEVEARVADICVVDETILRTLLYSFLDRLMKNDRKARRRRRQGAGEAAAGKDRAGGPGDAKAEAKAKAAAKAKARAARSREAAEAAE